MSCIVVRLVGILGVVALAVGSAAAHITPPVVLMSDREAVAGLLTGARRFFVREVRLTPQERQTIQQQTGWTPEDDFYRFYIGRDEQGRQVAATIFLTEYTVHGPVRVAVGLAPDGRVKGATVVELTEETYFWVKPLIDQDFAREFVGQGSAGQFASTAKVRGDSMTQFYGQVIASLIQRGAVLYDTTMLKRPG
jgi:Na+-translocating ferredoxin:NAD+ oxidoreductase RnfG subunit